MLELLLDNEIIFLINIKFFNFFFKVSCFGINLN